MVRYLLCAAALVLPASALQAEKTSDRTAPDVVRCVKVGQTGSLVKKTKVCRTNAEWARARETNKRDADDFVERNRGRPPGS